MDISALVWRFLPWWIIRSAQRLFCLIVGHSYPIHVGSKTLTGGSEYCYMLCPRCATQTGYKIYPKQGSATQSQRFVVKFFFSIQLWPSLLWLKDTCLDWWDQFSACIKRKKG